jgi:hypothetical protein
MANIRRSATKASRFECAGAHIHVKGSGLDKCALNSVKQLQKLGRKFAFGGSSH